MAVSVFSKQLLSGSTNGKAILIVATATPGTLIHTAVSGTTDFDEIHLWAANTNATDVDLTIEWGGTTAPDDLIETTITAEAGLEIVIPGLVLQNSLIVRAFASVTNVVNIWGYVNRITVP